MVERIDTKAAGQLSPADLFAKLETSDKGLSSEEAAKRLDTFGPNQLEEKRVHPLLKFLGYFWGPIPWMIEVAAVLSALLRHWADLIIILALLIFNAVVGFWQEYKAANALELLRKQLALRASVKRDGKWQDIAAGELVPGDIIQLRIGAIIPADGKLLDGDYLSVDQSALTGESLPVDKKPGEVVYSGSVARQGDMTAVVTATGGETYFGRTARLVQDAGAVSHFQKAVISIGDYLIYISLGLVGVLMVVQLFRHSPFLELIQFALILTVASIPVAMPAVLSVTMAVGAMALSKQKAIVSKLESIEEMAGIDILCSDKTGTLTQNHLTLGKPELFAAESDDALIEAAALASVTDNTGDAIDQAILTALKNTDLPNQWSVVKTVPFDPVHKKTVITRKSPDGKTVLFSKGAPRVMLDMAALDADTRARAEKRIDELAEGGYRTLGVARGVDGEHWDFLGLLALYDPPREDSADTLRRAGEHGISVKMVTGDDVAIGREIAGQLGLGKNIQPAGDLLAGKAEMDIGADTLAAIERADGFAQVFPEHKYAIVRALQEGGHLVAMTGDGVNDAPALKQADVGVAVSGATDAARAAADLILTAPGLSVIINAVEEARRIFERMNSYAIYRITETLRVMLFVVLAMLTMNFYPITAIMIILLAFFNDVPIMAIAYDNTWLEPKPVRWNMRRVLTVSTVMGLVGVISSFGLLLIARDYLKMTVDQIQTLVFLKMAVAGHLTLFLARTRGYFWKRPFPSPWVFWSAVVTKVMATLLVVYPMGLLTPLSWSEVGLIWGYAIVWMFVLDAAKVAVFRHFGVATNGSHSFIELLREPLHPHGGQGGGHR